MSRYEIHIITTDGAEEWIADCNTLKEVVGELLDLATRRDIECVNAVDKFRTNNYGGHAQITEA